MKTKKIMWWSIYLIVVSIVLLFASSRTSPLYSLLLGDYSGNKASTAILIGKYWTTGAIPYKDLFDVGGPVYFLIQAIGWLIGERYGIWIIQVVHLFLCMVLIQKIIFILRGGWETFIIPLFTLLVYVATCSGGNSASEWCILLQLLGIWIVIKENEEEYSNKTLFKLGILCGIGSMIHIQSNGILYGIEGWIVWSTIKEGKIKKGVKDLGITLVGFFIPIVLSVVYFGLNGALGGMVRGAILYPIQMLALGFDSTKVIVHKIIKSMLVVPLLFVGIYQLHKKEFNQGYLIIFISVATMLLLICGDNRWYYYIVSIPCIVLALGIGRTLIKSIEKWLVIGGCVLLSIGICGIPIKNYAVYLKQGIPDVVEEFITDVIEYKENFDTFRMFTIDTDSSYLLVLDEKPIVPYFAEQSDLELVDSIVEITMEHYMNETMEVDLLVTTEKGWVGQNFEKYTLVQVYCKKGGNICVYLPND